MKAFLIFTLLLYSCSGPDCHKLPTIFETYDEAEGQIENVQFAFEDKVNTDKSSWIRGASFLSCDQQSGFLILETDQQNYIHQNLPIHVWNEFKKAPSFGHFYHSYIKNNYQLQLSGSE